MGKWGKILTVDCEHQHLSPHQHHFFLIRSTETVGTKRKGSSRPGLPAKKPRKKAEVLDEKTMVALALSSSLYEQERLSERAAQTDTTSEMWISHTGITHCVLVIKV